jgi:predicted nucleic-acid-binding protein
MIFIDSNYFLRFLLDDVSLQNVKVKELFKKGAAGKEKLFTSTVVIFEIFWVLSSFYKKKKHEIIKVLRGLLEMSFIKLDESLIFDRALDIYEESSLEFEDCYNIAYAKNNNMTKFASFDKKLVKYLS